MEIKKIVLTGGPCAGKTTVITDVTKKLIEEGYYVMNVPETAREFMGGKLLPYADRNHTLKFQELLYRIQSAKEKVWEEYAQQLVKNNSKLIQDKKGIIIIYDRAVMDNRAYLEHEDYNDLLNKYNCNEIANIDKYDLVIDLISLATAKPELYELDGIRYETPEEAAMRDGLTSGAWLLHRNLKVVPPTETMDEKVEIVNSYIHDLLDKKIRKNTITFDIDKKDLDLSCCNNDNSRKIKIKSIYYPIDQNKRFVLSRREYNGKISYIRDDYSKEGNTMESRPISYDEYIETNINNKEGKVIEKEVISVIHKGVKFDIIDNGMNSFEIKTEFENFDRLPENIKTKVLKMYSNKFYK